MYSSINTLAHKFNMYPLLNSIVYFVKSTFIKNSNIPFISIYLFIVAIILNSIQYSKNDKNFLQNQIILANTSDTINSTDTNKLSLKNSILFIYDLLGINGFLINGLVHILYYILTYSCLSLIELNIGYIPLLFLLLIDIMFLYSWEIFTSAICDDVLVPPTRLLTGRYCCGSYVLLMSLAFVLYLIQNNLNNWISRSFVIFIILCVWIGSVITDYDVIYKNDTTTPMPQKNCNSVNNHAANFMFGIFCAIALGN